MTRELNFGTSSTESLLKCFEEVHDYIYAHDGLSPHETLEQMLYVLLMKMTDERTSESLCIIEDEEYENVSRDGLSSTFQERINTAFQNVRVQFSTLGVVEPEATIRLAPPTLAYVVRALQDISLSGSSHDVKGIAFQKFLASRHKGEQGQFFTPEPVIEFCVQMLAPQPHETIIDPACGTASFLHATLRYIQARSDTSTQHIQTFIERNLFGMEINAGVARIAKMKFLLECFCKPNIEVTNSLETDIDEVLRRVSVARNEATFEGFDIVLANPPFGAKISTRSLLSSYRLGHKWVEREGVFYQTNDIHNSQALEILFIERCLALLREGGRMAIVLPNGNLENPSLTYVREYIKRHADLLAVIALPSETFIPYGTGVKTSVLFLQKRSLHPPPSKAKSIIQHDTKKNIFFGKISKLGYQGNKNGTPLYKRDQMGNIARTMHGVGILDEDYSDILQAYHLFQQQQPCAIDNTYTLPAPNLNGRFDFDFYAPSHRSLLYNLQKIGAVRLADIADIVRTKSSKLSQRDEYVEYIELSDIHSQTFEIVHSTRFAVHELPSRASYQVQTGDIITAVAGNSIGTEKHASALVTQEHDGAICTNGFRVLRNVRINPLYLLYYLRTDAFLQQMYTYRTGAAIPSVSDADLSNILIYLPDEKTMQAIAQQINKSIALRAEAHSLITSIHLDIPTFAMVAHE
jgi:type I restriction enzyme M protein